VTIDDANLSDKMSHTSCPPTHLPRATPTVLPTAVELTCVPWPFKSLMLGSVDLNHATWTGIIINIVIVITLALRHSC
jgi:hypothetical protein